MNRELKSAGQVTLALILRTMAAFVVSGVFAVAANITIIDHPGAGATLIDGIATQVLRSGTGISPKDQRALIDAWIENWLKP